MQNRLVTKKRRQPHAVCRSVAIFDAAKLAPEQGQNLNQICDVMETSDKKIPRHKVVANELEILDTKDTYSISVCVIGNYEDCLEIPIKWQYRHASMIIAIKWRGNWKSVCQK